MEFEEIGEQVEGSGHVTWNSALSSFMLSYLANVVASGKTSTAFKKVHLNSCAKALSDHFKIKRTGDQIGNHLRYWKRRYVKINKLRKLSAALWDEENFVISLDHEHFTSYNADHKNDAEFFTKPIEHYGEMAIIFGGTVAMGKYAKGSNQPLATGIGENEQHQDGEDGDTATAAASNDGETSSAARPSKRAKTSEKEDDGLIVAMTAVGERLACAIEKAGQNKELPEELQDAVYSLHGFDETHLAFYHEHLVDHPSKAKAFYGLTFSHKLIWAAKFISEHFPPLQIKDKVGMHYSTHDYCCSYFACIP